MSKATTKARIQTEITGATVNESITPTIVGSILEEILELPSVLPYKKYVAKIYCMTSGSPLVLNVLENDTGVTPTLTRFSESNFMLTGFASANSAGKVHVLFTNVNKTMTSFIFTGGPYNGELGISNYGSDFVLLDYLNGWIEIRVYN
jgi:hypothetical protein